MLMVFGLEMIEYVDNRCYDSLFCELVPSIMANALNHIIVVINIDNMTPKSKVNVYDFFPQEYENRKPVCTTCTHKLGVLVLMRRSDHYDACVQTTKYSIPCLCKISSQCVIKENVLSDIPYQA